MSLAVSRMATGMSSVDTMIERALKRDRVVTAIALTVLCLLAWAWLLSGAGMGMTALDMTRMAYGDHSVMKPGVSMASNWTFAHALTLFAMWWVMMAAMMLPSAAPVILLAAVINRHAAPAATPFGEIHAFVAGYLLAWGAFSLFATAMQWALQASGLLSAMTLAIGDRPLTGALLIAAAAWQLTPLKQACLRQCRAPAGLLVASRGRSALRNGCTHGMYCVGCCWFLMLLLFVGGVMNLLWIVALAFYVLLEKVLPQTRGLLRLTAAVLGAAGIVNLSG
jgi:predicted metal-binding membrane protein